MDSETTELRSELAGARNTPPIPANQSTPGAGDADAQTTVAMRHIVCNDADDYCAHLSADWNVRFTQLQPGPFTAHSKVIPLGRAWVACAYLNKSVVHHNNMPKGVIVIGRPSRVSDPHSYHGRELKEGDVFVCGPETEVDLVNRGELYSNILTIPRDAPETESDWLNQSPLLTSLRGLTIQSPGTIWTTNFLNSMAWIVDAVEQYPQAVLRPEIRDSLTDQLLARITTVGMPDTSMSDDRQMKAQRRAAVVRARAYVEHHLTDAIRLSDLSRYARTQARSLEYGFREVLGLTPMAYVRAMRLKRARDLLRSESIRTRSVSEIAMDCGFWHLSQFAVDYKRMFGESPSVTFRRTEGQLQKSARSGTAHQAQSSRAPARQAAHVEQHPGVIAVA